MNPTYYGDSLTNAADMMQCDQETTIYDLEGKYQVNFSGLDGSEVSAWANPTGWHISFGKVTVHGMTLEDAEIIFRHRGASDAQLHNLKAGGPVTVKVAVKA